MRSTIGIFNKLGEKVARFCGEKRKYSSESGKLSELFKVESLSTFLPFESFDQENGLFVNEHSVGFIIETMPLVGGDEHHQKLISSLFDDFYMENASLQFLFIADHRVEPFLNWWSKSSEEGILKELAKHRKTYHEKAPFAVRNFRFFLSYSIPVSKNYANIAKNVSENRDRIYRLLNTITRAHCLGPQAFLELADYMLNFKSSPELSRKRHNLLNDLSSHLMTGGKIEIEKDVVNFDDEIVFKSFNVVDTPTQWSPFQMQNLIGDSLRDNYRINHPFFLHYGVHFPNQEKEERKFKVREHLIENQGKSRYLIRLIPDLATELQECDYVRRSVNKGSKFVWTQLSCGFWCHKAKAYEAEQEIKNIFKANEFKIKSNLYIQFPHLCSILPMMWGEVVNDLKKIDCLKTTLTTECPLFVPMQGEWSGTQSPGMLFVGRRGQLLNWNPFDNKNGNYNCVVFGKSGGGKSVFMQDLIMQGLRVGARVFTLDVGRSFEKLCNLVDGQFIEFSVNSNICLNPFSKIIINDQEQKEDAVSLLRTIIVCMISPSDGKRENEKFENALIEEAINAVWENKGNKATITDVSDFLKSKDNEKAQVLGIMLTPYTSKGVYAKYFEGENNIDFKNKFVVIELEELKGKGDLQSVVLQVIMISIANQAYQGDRKTPFYICIDEAWDLLRSPQTEEFIETLARRLRKYKGSLIVGTQNVEDFFTKPGAKAAFDNSDWMCFLSQKKDSIAQLGNTGKLRNNPGMLKALDSVTKRDGEYAEVMICDPNGGYSIARPMLDRFSNLLYSTKPEEYAKIKDLTNKGLSISDAINSVLNEEGR